MFTEGVALGQLGTQELPELLSSAQHGFPALAEQQNQLTCVKCRCHALTPLSGWNLWKGPRNLDFLWLHCSWLMLAAMFALGVPPAPASGTVLVGG